MKKKKKWKIEINSKDFAIGMFAGILIFFIVVGASFGAGLNNPFVRYPQTFWFDVASQIHINDPFVTEVVNHCEDMSADNKGLVACVVGYVSQFYNYEDRDNKFFRRVIRTPSEIRKGETAVCRDIAVVYDAVFRRYGWITSFILEDSHVYNHVAKNMTSCTINGIVWSCY